jgi:DNA-3-methyladenine glycosylase I
VPERCSVGSDGLLRCPWGVSPVDYRTYHDREWGRPTGEEALVFERLCLEGFQSGLSWLTILHKREAFRRAFAGFHPEVLARFRESDVARLLRDPGIVRHRGKIQAALDNARLTMRLHEAGESLAAICWSFEPSVHPVPECREDVPAVTACSRGLAAELRRRGFRFVGPTTAYALMQALGLVNDHLRECFARPEVDRERAEFQRPC